MGTASDTKNVYIAGTGRSLRLWLCFRNGCKPLALRQDSRLKTRRSIAAVLVALKAGLRSVEDALVIFIRPCSILGIRGLAVSEHALFAVFIYFISPFFEYYKLQLEVEFDTLADLERFWSSIPQGSHQKWSQSIQPLIVDGSPAWEIFRTIETFSSKVSSDNESKARGSLEMASGDEVQKFGAGAAPSLPTGTQTTASGLSVVENSDDADIVLDWKGEPMKINPGDKLPFKF